jgi:hypothetical protein
MAERRFGLYGEVSRDFLTFGGRIIYHPDAAELEWVTDGARVREIPRDIPDEQMIPLLEHPNFAGVTRIEPSQFRRPRRTA